MSDDGPWYRVGHVTHLEDYTGCTVVLFDRLCPTVVDVRGGAPGTRETDLLGPGKVVGRANAILLTGGSAFGLAAADGVMRLLSERGQGFPTSAGPIPVVPAAVIFDLANGTTRAPTAEDGYAAAIAAASPSSSSGRIGAGTGATVAKLGGRPSAGGLGIESVRVGGATVTAVVVINAVGDVRDPETGEWLARSIAPDEPHRTGRELALARLAAPVAGENTSIGAVLVSHAISRDGLSRCCIAAHDALARCVVPAHTIYDGDTFFASSPAHGESDADMILALAAATEVAVERAIVSVFRPRAGVQPGSLGD
jgi:L-aminopeptidase/D-esterase-like protein